jgi:hypothetical protein
MTDEEEEEVVARVVELPDGSLALDDPTAVAMITAVDKYNCKSVFDAQNDRVQHFVGRMKALGKSPQDVVIVLINADDVHGRHLADILMPGYNWQEYRDRGEVPFARGLAARDGIEEALAVIDQDAALKLKKQRGISVVVVDYGTAEVFEPGN